MTAPTIDIEKGFAIVNRLMSQGSGDITPATVAAKVAELVPGGDINAYHADAGVAPSVKFATYRTIVTSVMGLRSDKPAPQNQGVKPAPAPAPKLDVNGLFDQLCIALRKGGPAVAKRVSAHIRSKTGKALLPHYHGDKAVPDAEKIALYNECLAAVSSGKLDALAGTVGKGEAEPEKEEGRVDPIAAAAAQPAPPAPAAPVAVEEPETPKEFENWGPPPTDRLSAVGRAILEEISPFLPKREAAKPSTNKEDVEKIAEEVFKHQMGNGGFPTDRVKGIIDEALKAHTPRVELVVDGGRVVPVEGLMHPQATQIATWLRAVGCCWAWGAAGAGKTHFARQIAAMLEVQPYIYSVDPTTTVAKIMGYRNVANGDFVPGFAYAPFKDGGLLGADEIDTGDPGVIASKNALLSNTHYLFPNGETVEKNARFYCLAMANTKGMGAVAGYTARNKLDAATLDRFPVIEVKYDPGLELAIATGEGKAGEPWKPGKPATAEEQRKYVEWVQSVRTNFGNSVLISPRASINGCKALRAGIPAPEVVEALVFKLVTDDSKQRIKDKCSLPY